MLFAAVTIIKPLRVSLDYLNENVSIVESMPLAQKPGQIFLIISNDSIIRESNDN